MGRPGQGLRRTLLAGFFSLHALPLRFQAGRKSLYFVVDAAEELVYNGLPEGV